MSILAPPRTMSALLREAAAALRANQAATPELDARLLAAHATGLDAAALIAAAREPLPPEAEARFQALLARRLAGEPVARLLGRREFWGHDFKLSPATLIPRPDSETVVEAALDWVTAGGRRAEPIRILDLGTGSGCLLVALLMELSEATGIGIDVSEAALRTARANARAAGVGERAAFVTGYWAEAVMSSGIGLIVANPPYIPSEEIAGLSVEVAAHEPWQALDGGDDGLDCYRALLPTVVQTLSPDGALVLEHGARQEAPLAQLVEGAGLRVIDERADLSGVARVMIAAPAE